MPSKNSELQSLLSLTKLHILREYGLSDLVSTPKERFEIAPITLPRPKERIKTHVKSSPSVQKKATPIQKSTPAEPEKAPKVPKEPVIPAKAVVPQSESFDDISKAMQGLVPNLTIHSAPPSDEAALSRKFAWKHALEGADVLVIAPQGQPEITSFLKNLTFAINAELGVAKLVFQAPQSPGDVKMVIGDDTFPVSESFLTPQGKAQLWNALCERLK